MATGRISNETRRTIHEMAAAGESAEDIATTLGRNLNSVRRIMEGSTPKGSGKSSKSSSKSAKSTKKPASAPGRKPAKAAPVSEPAPAPAPAPAPRARRAASADSSATLTHHFWLRPGLEINLELPSDLSADEAQRLASVIQSLPFHS